MITYDFYLTNFRGSHFKSAESFFRALITAKYVLRKYNIDIESSDEDVKMCCCALSEFIDMQQTSKTAADGNIASETVSGYSVTYNNNTSFEKLYNQKIKSIINLYLGTGHAYRGVGRYVL